MTLAAKRTAASANVALIVAAPIVFGRLHVVPLVTEFLNTCPQVDVRLHLSDRVANLLYSKQGLLPVKLHAFLDFALPRLRTRIKELSRMTLRRCGLDVA